MEPRDTGNPAGIGMALSQVNRAHAGRRCVQYQAVLVSKTHRAAPALDDVASTYE